MDVKTQRIEKFVSLLHSGYNAWLEAGKIVAQEMELDYRFPAKVNALHPDISVDTVLAFDRIGRKKLHPMLAASNAPGVRRLRKLPYELQEKFVSEPIKVFIAESDTEDTAHSVSVFAMGTGYAKQVFDSNKVRTIEEQKEFIKSLNGGKRKEEPFPKFRRSLPEPIRLKQAPSPISPAGTVLVGRWSVRKTIGNNVGFERTPANPSNKVIVVLHDGVAVIEVVRMDKGEARP